MLVMPAGEGSQKYEVAAEIGIGRGKRFRK